MTLLNRIDFKARIYNFQISNQPCKLVVNCWSHVMKQFHISNHFHHIICYIQSIFLEITSEAMTMNHINRWMGLILPFMENSFRENVKHQILNHLNDCGRYQLTSEEIY